MNHDELLSSLGMQAEVLPIELDARNQEDFKDQFQRAFSCSEARDERGVVYLWCTVKPIPRLKSRSNVVYIGKTSNTLFERHHEYASVEAAEDNWRRYEHIIVIYGAISVRYAICGTGDSADVVESKLLRRYFDEHLEMPPLNRRM